MFFKHNYSLVFVLKCVYSGLNISSNCDCDLQLYLQIFGQQKKRECIIYRTYTVERRPFASGVGCFAHVTARTMQDQFVRRDMTKPVTIGNMSISLWGNRNAISGGYAWPKKKEGLMVVRVWNPREGKQLTEVWKECWLIPMLERNWWKTVGLLNCGIFYTEQNT